MLDDPLVARLISILDAAGFTEILRAINRENLPDWWLAGGAVRNTVWRSLFPTDCALGIKDFDVAFFDKDSGREVEHAARDNLARQFPSHKFDIKNQAGFGVWREWHTTFTSCEDGIMHWLHTATAVGVRMNPAGEYDVFQPYGLTDLFNGIVRATPFAANSTAAAAKAAEFLQKCPSLRLSE